MTYQISIKFLGLIPVKRYTRYIKNPRLHSDSVLAGMGLFGWFCIVSMDVVK